MKSCKASRWALFGLPFAVAISHAQPAPWTVRSFDIQATLDTSAAVGTKVVAANGAVLTATGRDGTGFRLTIPPKALPLDTVVTLTPLTDLAGVPGQTAHYGVDLAPAGMQLLEFAKLEITPAAPLPKRVYWLEHTGAPTRPSGRLAFPMDKARAMVVSHFSGGSVVLYDPGDDQVSPGSPLAFSADPASLISLQDYRNAIEQKYQQEAMDKAVYDFNIALIDKFIAERAAKDVADQLAAALEHERQTASETDEIAARGRLEDLDVLSQRVKAAIDAARFAALSGVRYELNPLAPVVTYFAAIVGQCETQRVPPATFLSLAHHAAVLGYEISSQDVSRCLCTGPDKPDGICPSDEDGVMFDIDAPDGTHAHGVSCHGLLGPWVVQLEGNDAAGSHTVFSWGPFAFAGAGVVKAPMRAESRIGTIGTVSYTGVADARLDLSPAPTMKIKGFTGSSQVCINGNCLAGPSSQTGPGDYVIGPVTAFRHTTGQCTELTPLP